MKNNSLSIYLEQIREASWASIAVVFLFDFLNLFLLFTPAHPLLIVFMPWILVVGLGIFALGKLRFSDLGITVQKIIPAIFCTLGIWVVIQMVFGIALYLMEGQISWQAVLPGYLLDQLLFFALTEEITFRGFLLPQSFIKIQKTGKFPLSPFWVALLISQAIFALSHIPHRLVNSTPVNEIPFQLGLVFLGGLFLSYVYLRTQNLLIAVGAHALGNYPTILFSHDQFPWYAVNLMVMGVTFAFVETWHYFATRKKQPTCPPTPFTIA